MHWYWIEPGRLAGGSCPASEDLPRLREAGFERILSLLEDERQLRYDPEEAQTQFEWYNVPMTDHWTPDIEQLLEVHRRHQEAPSRPLLVHCYAGIGRTGLVALSYLMTQGLPEAEAARRVDEWTGGAFSWEVRSRRYEIRNLLRDFLTQWLRPH